MNYTEIVALALSYADRQDVEVSDRMDDFLRIVESRINRVLRVGGMTIRAVLTLSEKNDYYSLPSDFAGLRDIEILADDSTRKSTLKYMSPEQLNNLTRVNGSLREIYYTIIAGQLQMYPQKEDAVLEIVYYQKLSPLTDSNPENWLSIHSMDAYVFGLLTEINSFVKDRDSSLLWDNRFKEVIDSIVSEDSQDRWSGTSLEVRVG